MLASMHLALKQRLVFFATKELFLGLKIITQERHHSHHNSFKKRKIKVRTLNRIEDQGEFRLHSAKLFIHCETLF